MPKEPYRQVLITSTTKGKLPSLPFRRMKEKVLGPDYELSVVLVGPKKIQNLNRIYRQKNKPTDILSFPLTKNTGEIFICLEQAKNKAKKFGQIPTKHADYQSNHTDYLKYLFIHGLLHLKGLGHGSRMEREEKAFASQFGVDVEHLINGKKNSGRHRYRNVPNQSGRGRKHGH